MVASVMRKQGADEEDVDLQIESECFWKCALGAEGSGGQQKKACPWMKRRASLERLMSICEGCEAEGGDRLRF